ncbi:DUF5683 domain-containing protein [Halocola ammonii]
MSFKISIASLLFLLATISCFSQNETYDVEQADTTDVESVDESDPFASHPPRKATIMSAVLPGLGQAYNKKYWKIPIVYAGIGTCVYFIVENGKSFRRYRDALIAVRDDDPNTVNTTQFNGSQLDQLQNTYRRWLDLSYVSLAAVYILQIIDANVDAHFFHFDISDDISLNWSPDINLAPTGSTGISLNIQF